jgi:hypothetical protein
MQTLTPEPRDLGCSTEDAQNRLEEEGKRWRDATLLSDGVGFGPRYDVT